MNKFLKLLNYYGILILAALLVLIGMGCMVAKAIILRDTALMWMCAAFTVLLALAVTPALRYMYRNAKAAHKSKSF